MHINNWYAACVAGELNDAPKRVTLLGANLVLFRDADGLAHCLSDLCVHRGASLSIGQCRDGQIECPQHGWLFNAAGRCTNIPAGSRHGTEPPKRARVPSYPVEEKYELLFVWIGDMDAEERPAIPDIMPEYETGEWHADVITRAKDISYLRMHENYNDPCHVHYIHEFAKWLPKGVTIFDHELTDTYVRAFHASWNADGEFSEKYGLMMEYNVISSVSRNTNYQKDYPPQIVTAYVTPVDEFNSLIHMIILMPKQDTEVTVPDGSVLKGSSADEHRMMVDMTRDQVMDEDYVVLKTTQPVLAASPQEELLVETDRTIAQVRKITVDYAEQQGVIDTRAWDEVRAGSLRVLPCPEHRSDPKNWVHKTVPLQQGTGQSALKAAS